MPARTSAATAIPAVRSSSMRARPGSSAIRAACRYSSRRCADRSTLVPATIAAARPTTPTATLLRRKLGPVVVGRVAIDGVNVVDAALRGIFDHQRRSLDAKVVHAAVGGRAAPREVG